jgi:hypothetical protein
MRAALILALLAATPASAACQGDEAFSCQIGQKTLELCYWKGMLTYSYGRDGKPELTLTEPLETVAYTPWPGIGRTIWDTVAFRNAGVTYEVWTSFDKMDENAILEGGVYVMEGETMLASPTCDRGSVAHGLDTISFMKAGIGQCWAPETQSWGSCN